MYSFRDLHFNFSMDAKHMLPIIYREREKKFKKKHQDN